MFTARRCTPSPHIGTPNCAVICAPAQIHGARDDELGDIGEPVAHLHQRQHARQIRHRHAKHRRTLELAQGLDLLLRILLAQLFHAGIKIAREGGPLGQLRQQPLVNELIQQQRVGGDLGGEKIPVAAQLHQARARRAVLAQQREVRRALPDRLDDREHPAQHRQLRAAVRHVGQQHRQQRLQPPAPRLIELAHQRRATQLQQQARHLRAVVEASVRQGLPERRRFRLRVPEAPEVDAYRRLFPLDAAKDDQAEVRG